MTSPYNRQFSCQDPRGAPLVNQQEASQKLFGGRNPRTRSKSVALLMKVASVAILWVSVAGVGLYPSFVGSFLKGLGGALVLGIAYCIGKRGGMAGEVKLYFAFVLWAGLSAIAVARDLGLSLDHSLKILQVGILFWAVAEAHRRSPDLRIVMAGIWGLGAVWALLVYVRPGVQEAAIEGGKRLSVIGENPNSTGQVFVFAIFASLYLWQRVRRLSVRVGVLAGVPLFLLLLMLTGSRKMLIGVVILVATWLLTGVQVNAARGKRLIAYVLLVLTIGGTLIMVISSWEGSLMARRWAVLDDSSGTQGRFASRDVLVRKGWALFLAYPIAGVGLGNQPGYMGSLAHSEYVDVLASTGAVGAGIYFSIYVVAFRRGRRVARGRISEMLLDWRAFKVYLILLAWLMVGFQRFDDFFNILMLGSFVGCFLAYETSRFLRKSDLFSNGPAGALQRRP